MSCAVAPGEIPSGCTPVLAFGELFPRRAVSATRDDAPGLSRKGRARYVAAWRGGFREQNIVEKLARAFRPGEGKRVRSCFAARNFKCGETSGAQIHVEYAGATRAD